MSNFRPYSNGAPEPPCRNCDDRRAGCHAVCPRYRGWRDADAGRREETARRGARKALLDRYYADTRQGWKSRTDYDSRKRKEKERR